MIYLLPAEPGKTLSMIHTAMQILMAALLDVSYYICQVFGNLHLILQVIMIRGPRTAFSDGCRPASCSGSRRSPLACSPV